MIRMFRRRRGPVRRTSPRVEGLEGRQLLSAGVPPTMPPHPPHARPLPTHPPIVNPLNKLDPPQ